MRLPLKEYIGLLYKYLNKQRKSMIILMVILVLNVGLQLVNPQIIRYFIDAALKGKGNKNLIAAAMLFIGFAVIRQVFIIISAYIGENLGWQATNSLRLDLIEHCIKLDMAFHKRHQSGELIERVDGDVNALFKFFSTFMLNLSTNAILLIGILVLLLIEDLRIGITLTGFSILAIVIMGYIEKKSSVHWVNQRENNAKLYGFLGEQITSVDDINTCGAKTYTMNNLYRNFRKLLPVQIKSTMGYYHMWMANLVIFSIGNVMALLLSAYLFQNSQISFGTLYLIFYYTELMVRPLEEIKSQMQELQKAEASIRRVKEVFNTKSSIEFGKNTINPGSSIDLSLSNVFFRYEEGEAVLKNINLHIPKNTVLGVLGHTGSGKTTLARLIVRLYDVSSGSIKINGENLIDVSEETLRESISYVTQEVQIFHTTVRNNLTFFNPNIGDKVILAAINDIGLASWLEKLPNGLDTMLDNGGSGLSAGEAQLLAFVRVFLKNSKLVILDEATSRLDPITEGLIDKALNKLLKDRTCIIIAHRLWTVQRADNILILEDGAALEYGQREGLSTDNSSKFYSLLQTGMEEVLV